jgi:hypothetical protein
MTLWMTTQGKHLTNKYSAEPYNHPPTGGFAFDDKVPTLMEECQELGQIKCSMLFRAA